MFRRFLGTIFLYFYVIPAFSQAVRTIIMPVIAESAQRIAKEELKKREMESQFDKNNTPEWAREAHRQRS